MSADEACLVLGVAADVEGAELRATFRGRMRELHRRLMRRQPRANRSRPGRSARIIGEPQRGLSPRLVQMVASVPVFGASVLLLFFLVAFSQSGR